MSPDMSRSKSHYYRSRLLRERIRKEDASSPTQSTRAERTDVDDDFELPDYFSTLPPLSNEDEDQIRGRYPKVILWDEVA
jgi:hypothetical protein